jgi:hypothetical protein
MTSSATVRTPSPEHIAARGAGKTPCVRPPSAWLAIAPPALTERLP